MGERDDILAKDRMKSMPDDRAPGPSFDRRLFVPLDIRAVDALDALRAEREYQVVRRTGMMRLAFPP
jgi:hypothetical protein